MLSQLLTYGKFGHLFCGIEHTIIDGKENLNVLILRKKKGELLIENTFECDKIVKLNDQLQKGQHLFLIINDEQVLFKVLKGVNDSTQKVIALAFPNLKIEDFYYEICASSDITFIAICRKEYIDSILKEYNALGLNVINFSLGNLIGSQLSSYVNNSAINSSNARLAFLENSISNIEKLENNSLTKYTINGLKLTNKLVLPLAGIIAYYTNQETTVSNFKRLNNELSDNFKYKRVFDLGLKVGLSIVFVLLLVSFLFFSYYATEINSLNNEVELNKTNKNSFVKLADEVEKKERLVTNFSLSSSRSSWYLDQIAEALPHAIILSEIQFQPLEKSINPDPDSYRDYREEKQIVIQEYIIIIKGKSNSSNDFSSWINKLEQQNWIKKVMIQEYGTGKKTATAFELKIELNK
ncbi:MAG: hypothetical protein L3J20_01860 [Flavobacteriaceae bacterium]|nr:hypothetical protein [Flavobacteriaceae bacterium]